MKLSDIGEFGFIERIASGCIVDGARVVQGIGDDCAVTRGGEGMLHLMTTDMLVEGVHFLRHLVSARQLGAKAMAVNLSDVAAMGGRPLHAFVSVAVPEDISLEYLDELYAGMIDMAGRFGVNLLGGDTTRSRADLVLNIALSGEVEESRVIYRSGARPGDRIYVTGALGDAGAGLEAMLHGEGLGAEVEALVRRHLEPRPHVIEGQHIAATGFAHAMIDISDGLAGDLGHICRRSGVGCVVEVAKLPLSTELVAYCQIRGLDPLAFALGGGEDYVLLLTGSRELPASLQGNDVVLVEIGEIVAGRERILAHPGSRVTPLADSGWDHFRSAPSLVLCT